MSWYPKAIRKNIPPPHTDPKIKARVAILHVAASEGPSLYGWFNGPSGGVESHFYIRYDGTVEQYRDTGYQADANMSANDFAVSIETEGKASGKWTSAQLAAIKALLKWLHEDDPDVDIPLTVCKAWNGSGVGYHILFEDEWDGRHASCPGPNRIIQFNNNLVPWMAGDEGFLMSLNDTEQDKVLLASNRSLGFLQQRYWKVNEAGEVVGCAATDAGARPTGALDTLDGNYLVGKIASVDAKVSGLVAAFQAFSAAGGSDDDLAGITAAVDKAVNDAFDARVQSANVVITAGA